MTDPGGAARGDDKIIIERLRAGDETVFEQLIESYHAPLLRLAGMYASDPRVAEEVVQETWIAVLRGLAKFEGRSSLKTWIYSILVNRAKTSAQREGRYRRQESLDETATDPGDSGIPLDRLVNITDKPPYSGHWATFPTAWEYAPEARFDSVELQRVIHEAIDSLPDLQREVITLRDINAFSSDEVCNILSISETNQRVLLHRARTRVRRALEKYLVE